MNTHVNNTSENKQQAVANNLPKQQHINNPAAPTTAQEAANNSPQAAQFKAYETMANNSSRVKQLKNIQALADSSSKTIQQKENKTGLPDNLKSGIENLSGLSMNDVKVHYNSSQPAQLNAHAYAQGTDIHIAAGQEKHLPHEAWHVAQQKQGRVKPTLQMKKGVPVNDDKGLEHEADVMGAKASGMAHDIMQQVSTKAPDTASADLAPVQGRFIGDAARALTDINMGILDSPGAFYFTKFRQELSDSAENIIISHAGDTSYDAGGKVLSINPMLLKEIDKFIKQKMYGLKEGETAISGAEIVSYISTISHELSHARDHIILGKNISETTLTVIETELKAWAVEAIEAILVSKSVKDMDKAKAHLIDSWLAMRPEMLDDLWANSENEVAARLLRYIIRGIKNRGKMEINEWIGENRAALNTLIVKFQTLVASKVPVVASEPSAAASSSDSSQGERKEPASKTE